MGQSQSMSAEVEIQASPDAVRTVFMDFPQYKEWTKWNIEPAVLGTKSTDLSAKDKLNVNLGSMKFSPVVVENSPETFQWNGNLWPIFAGKHEFHWKPSTKNPGGTTFVQKEVFIGLFAFLMAPGWNGSKSTLVNWEGFNADLKKEVERISTQS
ncbi:hypothetical protein BKA67DRAFT_664474 [Truncatella angustata]|uniref:SRPBCC domain-containing protein n=1 Tax=Truncatella angustata TaxID=152316 RepID=A0A9P8RJU2_9PEZI|nr:uncharacterized protein BKA67DRAFT_664474 [Truncatella angustata]KAH6645391.1 hypothetical protein BKA67DRAFT_664474 [Truncatella angustata]KAH8197315.1 hypothetical protein TruAng_008519 [Truncatella angustata]